MKFLLRPLVIPFVATSLLFYPLNSQTMMLSGSVRDAVSLEPLPAATIRVVGSDRGTIANSDGSFRLSLQSGTYRCAFSFIGYRPDTLAIAPELPLQLDIRLQPSPVQMAEVVVSGEDPAIAIMRQVIERKKKWQDALGTYQFEAFTRQTLRRDTAIASIAETFTTGFWRRGDTLREVIRQKRQTQNVPEARNFAAVGGILNFYEDDIRFAGYNFVGFTAPSAFDYYGFKLEGSRTTNGRTVYQISLNPRSRLTPLFHGTIQVVDEQFALVGTHVRPNEAFVIPFLPDFTLEYRQQFALVRDRYWMPVDIRMHMSVKISIPGFSIPTIGLDNVSSITDYQINVELPDSLFQQRRIRTDSTAVKYDSTEWAQREVLPLTTEEHEAYQKLDSTQTLDKQFRPTGPLGNLDSSGLSMLKYVALRYSRVEGLYLGGAYSADSLWGTLSGRSEVGYGIAEHRWQGELVAGYLWGSSFAVKTSVELYSHIRPISDEGYQNSFSNIFTALFGKNDYFDYFRAEGGRIKISAKPLKDISLQPSFAHERHRSVIQNTNYSFFYYRELFRPQPAIQDGTMRTVGLSGRWGNDPIPFNLIPQDELQVNVEHSSRNVMGGDFDFSRVLLQGQYRIATFLRRNLFPAQLTLRLSAGTSYGSLPVQRQFSLETQSSDFAPLGVLRAGRVKEFAGDRFAQLAVEHNFRSAFFLWVGLPYFYESGVETVTFATVAASSFKNGTTQLAPPIRGLYIEAGVGINKLFQLLRLDVTYRFYSPEGFRLTLGIAQFL